MNKVGLTVTINKFKNHFSSVQTSIVCDNMDETHLELVKYIAAHFTQLNIDFPDNLDEFHNIWFNQTYVNADVFTYNCFYNNNHLKPWSDDEIYDDVLEALHLHETRNAPNFAELYGEPTDENSSEQEDSNMKFTSSNKMIAEFEETMNKIIDKSKNIDRSKHANNCDCDTCNKGKDIII